MAKNKFLKKFISLFLAVGMILCMMPVLAFSEANTTLTISNKEISANGSGNVTVDISANSQVTVIQFVIRYDTTKLQLNSVTAGTVAASPDINSGTAGEIRFVWDDTTALTAGGTLMTMNFSPKEGFIEGSSSVEFGQEQGDEFIFGFIGDDMQYVPIPVTEEAGTVTVVDYILGDVNGDNEVDAYDLTMLARHLGKIETITNNKRLSASDVTKDGEVDAYDLTKLARYLGKIDSEL